MKKLKYTLTKSLHYTLSTIILCIPAAIVTYYQYIDYITYGII